jgi:hypothetical protein
MDPSDRVICRTAQQELNRIAAMKRKPITLVGRAPRAVLDTSIILDEARRDDFAASP